MLKTSGFFDGKYIEKTDDFYANTSINYNGAYYNGYLTSSYFVSYLMDGKQLFLDGDFVIEVNENREITRIYKTKFE